ncbi:MAG: STAS domain-containing protein [Magnetococcales bacterium]|nr:STAS domain-containing protein [Magnetococcales bacterium]
MIVTNVSHSTVSVRLPTEFNFKMHREFRDLYVHRSPRISYEIDFQGVTHFDSSALGMLLLMRNHCGDDQANISLINCNPRIMLILKTATFDNYFRIMAS